MKWFEALASALLLTACATNGSESRVGTQDRVDAPGNRSPPVHWREGMTLPRPVDPGCVEKGLESLAPFEGYRGPVVVRFVVSSDGTVDEVTNAGGISSNVTYLAVRDVLQRCAWVPGKDVDGRPASVRAAISFQFGSRWPIAPWVN